MMVPHVLVRAFETQGVWGRVCSEGGVPRRTVILVKWLWWLAGGTSGVLRIIPEPYYN